LLQVALRRVEPEERIMINAETGMWSLALFGILATSLAVCTSSTESSDDASEGTVEGVSTAGSGFTFTRKLNVTNTTWVQDALLWETAAASGHFAPSTYATALFEGTAGDSVDFGSNTWGSVLGIWTTSTLLFGWAGPASCLSQPLATRGPCGANDGNNWSLLQRNDSARLSRFTFSRDGRYLVIALTTPSAYKWNAGYRIFVGRVGDDS
jgi:hypothetical protein